MWMRRLILVSSLLLFFTLTGTAAAQTDRPVLPRPELLKAEPETRPVERAQKPPRKPASDRMFVVQCQVVEHHRNRKERIVASPQVAMLEGIKSHVVIGTEIPVVSGNRGANQQRVLVVNEGVSIELVVHHQGDQTATIDVAVAVSNVDVATRADHQTARVETHKSRIIRQVTLGKEIRFPIAGARKKGQGRLLRLVVRPMEAE